MADLACHLVSLSAGVSVPAPLELDHQGIASRFASASSNKLALHVSSGGSSTVGTTDAVGVPALHRAARTLGNKKPPASTIGVFFAGRFSGNPNLAGLMFDHDFNPSKAEAAVSREGCAIFLGSMGGGHISDSAAVAAEAAYAAVHELGHVFNLGHVATPGNLMAPFAPPSFDGPFAFSEAHQSLLALCDSPQFANFIIPGATRYGDIGDLPGGGDYNLVSLRLNSGGALTLAIEMSQREFWRFEPIELDLIVSANGDDVVVPDVFDPAYGCFQIWIEKPDGERYRYRPTKRFCNPNRTRTIREGQPFRRDISIFGGAEGFTFQRAGIHRVFAILLLEEGGQIQSNTLDVNVKARNDRYDDWAATLSDTANAQFLFYRHASPTRKTVRTLESFADKNWSEPAAAAVAYAIGRAHWQDAIDRGRPHGKSARKAKEFLKRAEAHRGLSVHRRENANAIIVGMNES